MSNDSVSVSGPIRVMSDSPERVAFELMHLISSNEDVTKDRRYFLTLYTQCYKATHNHPLDSILK
jgi:hypothetical protein